ncbi:MarR family winged helix-turn-helix transcriptional regulator [Cellulomonas sp. URHB0016]
MSAAPQLAPALGTPPSVDSARQELLRSVERFARSVREASYLVSRQLPCSRGSVPVVRMLDRRGTMQVGDIADVLHVDISVASRQVSNLVAEGYVERTVDDGDRRVRTLRLTPAGKALAAQMRAALDRRTAEILTDWDAADVAACTDALDRLTASVDASTRAHHLSDHTG